MTTIKNILAKLGSPKPNNAYKENSKRRIISYAKNEQNEFFVLKLLKNIFIPKSSKYLQNTVKERILFIIKKKKISFFDTLFNFFDHSWVKLIASTLTASFFIVFVIWTNSTSAIAESKLILIKWNAQIKHLWEDWKKIKKTTVLSIWDTIKTSNNSLVEIYFYDNSISRIADNTQVSITSLTTNLLEKKPTILKLSNWRMWNQIITWENNFKIETKNASVFTKEWIFDIIQDWETKVNVISKPIKIRISWEKNRKYSKISAGFWIKANKKGIKTKKIESEDERAKKNKIADKRHREKLVSKITEKTLEELKILPSNLAYFNNIWWEKNPTSIAKKRIQELKILNLNKNSVLIKENKKIISDLIWNLEIYEKLEVSNFLSDEIKKLKVVIPWDNLYEYKIYISKIAQKIDPDKIYTKAIINERLYEAHEIANTVKDKKQLIVALNNFNEFRKVWTWNILEKKETELKEELLDKNEQLFLLQSIENTLEKDKDLKKEVVKEKQVIAKEIKEILVKISKDESIWKNLKNTLSTKVFIEKIDLLTKKVDKYKTNNWKENTLHWILKKIPSKKSNLDLLYSLRAKFDWKLSVMISKKIMKIKRNKDK